MKGKEYRQTAGGFALDNFDITVKDGTTEKELSSVMVDFDRKKIILETKKKTAKEG